MKPHPCSQCERCGTEGTAQFHIDVMGDCARVCLMCLTEDELFVLSCGPKQ